MDITKNSVIFFVNGVKIVDKNVDPETTLLRYLRETLSLPGTKLGCGEGGCGACTVMVSRYNEETDKIEHISVNACLCPVVCLHGMAVVTVEGIGSTRTRLHPVQERIAKSHGSQCGFCTPGFVMSMYTLLRTDPSPSLQHIEENLVGNLCRCTGYRPIIEGFRTFSSSSSTAVGCGKENCCMLTGNTQPLKNGDMEDKDQVNHAVNGESYLPFDSTQEVIFPPELKVKSHEYAGDIAVVGPRVSYYRPTTLKSLLELKSKFPNAKLICGNTEIGVEVKFKNELYPVLINPTFVKELMKITKEDKYFEIGAGATLSKIEESFMKFIKQSHEWEVRTLQAVLEMLKLFAGKQIRNVATMGGNLMTSSPISDLIPILVAAKAEVVLMSDDSVRNIVIDNNFFTGYRRNVVLPTEVMTSIRIPYTNKNEFLYAFKQAKRKDDDIAIVNLAMFVEFEPEKPIVRSAILAFGGMGPTVVVAEKTTNKMKTNEWNDALLQTGISNLLEEVKLHPSVVGGMAEYRQTLAASLFYKYFLMVKRDLHAMYPDMLKNLSEEEKSAIKIDPYSEPQSWQLYNKTPGQDSIDPVGKPIVHASAYKQASGEAVYIDDIPKYRDELYAGYVMSTKARAKLVSIDASVALAMEGVHNFFCAEDIPAERNITGLLMKEKVFASEEVICVGQIIGIVIADNQQLAQRGARAVKVVYEETDPPIITIEQAIERNSLVDSRKVEIGDLKSGFEKSSNFLEGEVHIGGQEHFYLETVSNLIMANSEGEVDMFCSTQCTSSMQARVAFTLGIPRSQVNCRVKRLGGGFGGKESRPGVVIVPMAVAAYKLKKPIRSMLDRDEDMVLTGGRNPVMAKWKVGFGNDGRIVSIEVNAYINSGSTTDITFGVMMKFVLTFGICYNIPNARITIHECQTNLASNTAFRGFGAPQAQFVMENILENVASFLQIDAYEVRHLNLYSRGVQIINGNRDDGCNLRQCWDEVILQSDYHERLINCKIFNRKNRYRKRGISVAPAKYGIAFLMLFLNQGGALVNIYADGSVLLHHGGVEMGQGLYTKMIQVASKTLGIPVEKVSTVESACNIVPNTMATAASTSSDINGMAIFNACTELNKRLEPYLKRFDNNWEKAVMTAHMERTCLFAEGFYKIPNMSDYNFETGKGKAISYYTSGVAVTEVEIDCLTGHHTVLQTDIVMDVGNSLNPAIDIGQIEGAYVQGMGLYTIEELVYSPDGVLLTRGPGSYKIPSIQDSPRKFNVSLLKGVPNPLAIYSSKGVGEPPLLLASSVFFAIRQAINATRRDNTPYRLDSPATAERIRLACQDWIKDQVPTPEPGSFKPWGIGAQY